jgi:pilus assembly protein Flp/PilA
MQRRGHSRQYAPCPSRRLARSRDCLIQSDPLPATAIEYGLIPADISIAIILAVNGLGTTLNGVFTNVNTQLR